MIYDVCIGCRSVLTEIQALLSDIEGAHYTFCEPGKASIGQHVRHVCDHFKAIFDRDYAIRYDQRDRGTQIETNAFEAQEYIAILVAQLDEIESDTPVNVEFVSNKNPAEHMTMSSSLARELHFAMHHAVHHKAEIKRVCEAQNIVLEEDFTWAPATRAHYQKVS